MMDAMLTRFGNVVRGFWSDTSGVILPYVTIMLVVIVGTSVLALDGSRYMSLQTQLQKAADAFALAAAAELDRFPDAIDRANRAITNNITNNKTLVSSGGGGVPVTVSVVRFLSSLPNDDTSIATWAGVLCTAPACTAANAVAARFVEVRVQPVTMPTILPVSFIIAGNTNTYTTGAQAVAGHDTVSCGLAPLFICNPFEQAGDTYSEATARLVAADADPTFKRKLIRLADPSGPGASGTWGPGDFGYLVPEPGTLPSDACFPAGQEIGKAMAMDKPLICVRQNGVDLMPGNATTAIRGLNTRFGKYGTSGPLSNAACKTAYPPDLNVRTGWEPSGGGSPSWCGGGPAPTTTGKTPNWPPGDNNTALPADSCLLGSNSCSPIGNLGLDTWDCLTYWNAAHGQPLNGPGIIPPPGCTNTAAISRYSVYQYELDTPGYNNHQSVAIGGPPITHSERGVPAACTVATPKADRRMFHLAVINCGSSPVTIQSNAQNVPVAAFARFFLTVAPQESAQGKPYAEFQGLIEMGGGRLNPQVQLYR